MLLFGVSQLENSVLGNVSKEKKCKNEKKDEFLSSRSTLPGVVPQHLYWDE